MIETRQSDRLALGDEHLHWIKRLANAEAPPVSESTMLARLIDEAIVRRREIARRRARQLEVYEASGYSEHHPDYPDLPQGLSDV